MKGGLRLSSEQFSHLYHSNGVSTKRLNNEENRVPYLSRDEREEDEKSIKSGHIARIRDSDKSI